MYISQNNKDIELQELGDASPSDPWSPLQADQYRPPPYTPYLDHNESRLQLSTSPQGVRDADMVHEHDASVPDTKDNPPTTKGGFKIRSILLFLSILSLLTTIYSIVTQSILPELRTVQSLGVSILYFLCETSALFIIFVTQNGNQLLVIFVLRCLLFVVSIVVVSFSFKQGLQERMGRQNSSSPDDTSSQNIVNGFLSFMLAYFVFVLVLAATELKFIWMYAHYLLKVAGKESIFSSWRWPFSRRQ